ncbi:uncharacterized protein LOC124418920 [Lucilia cuprina]|uniref:uncharacterized protein LOC124418920 n=1 Tax=Lucilia cuprina TaxID=7375 RepID=UPI001F06C7C7|nr:uncharacterized protein LOC124418920 [Lucilia cuprina]
MCYKITTAHIDCKEDNIKKVSLLMIHCRGLCEQDYWGRTPLHLAIIYKSQATLKIFQNALQKEISPQNLKNNNNINKNLKFIKNLKKLFKIYDHDGDTILHKAVKYNLTKIVEFLLKFCKKFNINVNNYEVLGSGDSILHLAIVENLLKMTKIIIEINPSLRYVRNYAGNLPQDAKNLSMEMQMLFLDSGER